MKPIRSLPYGVGELPNSWSISPLKYLATLSNGYVFKSDSWTDSGTPIIRIENLNGSIEFNYSTSQVNKRHHVGQGDLLFAWSGNPGTSFGPFRWERPGLHYLNQHIFKTSVVDCGTNTDWLYWSLKAATHWIERELTSGMIGMVHVTKEELSGVPIPLPPVEEQHRIANFLDIETARLDSLIDARNAQIKSLEQLWESQLASQVNNLILEHGLIPLRRTVLSVEQGWSPQCDEIEATPSEWAVLKTSAVSTGQFMPLEHKRLPFDMDSDMRYRVADGDILMTRGSGSPAHVGVATIARTEGRNLLFSDLLYRIKLAPGWDPEFVKFSLASRPVRGFMSLLFRGQSGQTIKLRADDIKSLDVPATPSALQAGIARELTTIQHDIRRAKAALQRSNALLTERRRALITSAVTGQFDVSSASGRGVDTP